MEVKEKIVRYINEFNDDPLYKRIEEKGLLDELLSPPSYFETIDFADAYSTKIATELLNMQSKDQTIINYINRPDFKDYIQIARRANRFYRFDWKSLFKFKMIFLLNREGYSPMDLATLIGKVTDIVEGEGLSKSLTAPIPNIPSQEETIESAKEEILPIVSLLSKKNQIESALQHNEEWVNFYEMNLKERQDYVATVQLKKNNNKGFFNSLFRSTTNDTSLEELKRAEEMIKQYSANIDRLNTVKESLLNEKKLLVQKLLKHETLMTKSALNIELILEKNGEIENDNVHEENE